jgi:hypothetical protein
MSHEAAAALETRLNIERYQCYLAVYEKTGGLILPYTHGYPVPEVEIDD